MYSDSKNQYFKYQLFPIVFLNIGFYSQKANKNELQLYKNYDISDENNTKNIGIKIILA